MLHHRIRFWAILYFGVFAVVGCGDRAGGVNIWSAVDDNDAEAIARYAAAGGNLDCKDFWGNTPLMDAFDNGHAISYKSLLEAGADPNISMSEKRTLPAWAAGRKDDTTWLRLALQHGGDPNLLSFARGSKHMITPLDFGTSNGTVEHAKLLIDHGADVNQRTPTKQTPLNNAMILSRFEIVLLLLESGADYTVEDTPNISFLEDVQNVRKNKEDVFISDEAREGFEEVETWLVEHGVKFEE